MKSSLRDEEFGEISIKRVSGSRHVRVSVTADGQIRATMPRLAPLYSLKHLIDSSRLALRRALDELPDVKPHRYEQGSLVGASHHIFFTPRSSGAISSKIHGLNVFVYHPATLKSDSEAVQAEASKVIRRALDKEAKAHLPRRLAYLADEYGFTYTKMRFGNAKGRWGSCSSTGTITLNVALMNLPPGLIDYVLVHELCHTEEMNHSKRFWELVRTHTPNYVSLRKQLKKHSPYI